MPSPERDRPLQLPGFDFLSEPNPVGGLDLWILVAIIICYLVAVRTLGTRTGFDPLYVFRCSPGSLAEICKQANKRGARAACLLWEMFSGALRAVVFIDLARILTIYIFQVMLPPTYTNILIGALLLLFLFTLCSKLTVYVVCRRQLRCEEMKLSECFPLLARNHVRGA